MAHQTPPTLSPSGKPLSPTYMTYVFEGGKESTGSSTAKAYQPATHLTQLDLDMQGSKTVYQHFHGATMHGRKASPYLCAQHPSHIQCSTVQPAQPFHGIGDKDRSGRAQDY